MEGYEGFVNGMPQVTESRNEELKKTVRIFPHRMKGEGHFLALLQKGEAHPALPSGTDTGKPKKLPARYLSSLNFIRSTAIREDIYFSASDWRTEKEPF